MILEIGNYIESVSLDDAWREAIWLCAKNGYDFVIEHGSYAGQIRRQLPNVTIKIKEPWRRPLAPITPPGYPPPTSDEKIEKYFLEYIINDKVHGNEDYTYGQFIAPQLPKIIEMLIKSNGNTNQASISIGDKNSVNLSDPPCLRVINFKNVNGFLQMSVLFRSWDLYGAFSENLGGLQMLKEYVVSIIEDCFKIKDGPIIAYSDGLHLYDHFFDLANSLNIGNDIIMDDEILNKKSKFNKVLDGEK